MKNKNKEHNFFLPLTRVVFLFQHYGWESLRGRDCGASNNGVRVYVCRFLTHTNAQDIEKDFFQQMCWCNVFLRLHFILFLCVDFWNCISMFQLNFNDNFMRRSFMINSRSFIQKWLKIKSWMFYHALSHTHTHTNIRYNNRNIILCGHIF